MKLVLPLPDNWARSESAGTTTAQVAPGVTLRVEPFRPLPLSVEAWRDWAVFRGMDRRAVKVLSAEDAETESGWPVGLALSEVEGARRLHVLYRFVLYGCVAVLESGDRAAFDAAVEEVKGVLLSARPDFSTDRVVALSDLWEGLTAGDRTTTTRGS